MHAKRYWPWTRLLLQKLHPVNWTWNIYVMLQLFLHIFMLIEVAVLNIWPSYCALRCADHFTLANIFLGIRNCVWLHVPLHIYLRKYKAYVLEFMLAKIPFTELRIFFSCWLHAHRRYREKKKKIPKKWPILPQSTLFSKELRSINTYHRNIGIYRFRIDIIHIN